MNKSRKSFSLEEYKIQASILLKSLRGSDSAKAAKRFQRLPEFTKLSVAEILQQKIQRKHALQLIALEHGFRSWVDLKIQIKFIVGGYLNSWFTNYAEAKAYLQQHGGYLLPYKNHFFICNAQYIRQIGFNPDDPNWKLIEYDWAEPADKSAWKLLYQTWSQFTGGRHE